MDEERFDSGRVAQAEAALRQLPVADEGGRAYLEKHFERLARTLALVPEAKSSKAAALELGCYMQITPFLQRMCGYGTVRGAYYGKPRWRAEEKTVRLPDGGFTCKIDLFDAERDRFPYPDASYDLVLAGEIIEHMLHDPMHLLLESRRVLRDGGHLLLTTPNAASVTSVAKLLEGRDNPQIYSSYGGEIGHMREYTADELRRVVDAAGFRVERLFTTFLEEYAGHRPLLETLRAMGRDTEMRGEQSWCLAVKDAALAVERRPGWLYG